MADETFEWDLQFNLTGGGLEAGAAGLQRFAGAAQKGQKAILEFEQGGQKMKATFEAVGSGVEKAQGAMGGFVATLGDVVHAARALFDAVKKPFELLSEFGNKATDAFSERQSSIRAYTALLGDAKQAQIEFTKAQQLATKLPFLSSQIEDAQQTLFVGGLRNEGGKAGGSADQALAAVADLASLAKDRGLALERGSQVVGKIAAGTHLDGKEVKELRTDLKLNIPLFYEEIAKQLGHGTKAANVEELISKKKVSSEVGLSAFKLATKGELHENKLGDFAAAGANTLGVALINQQEQVKNLLKTFDSELLPGVQRYKAALQEQGDVFNIATEQGKSMSLALRGLASDSLNAKSIWADFETSFFSSFATVFNAAAKETGDQTGALNSASVAAKRAGEAMGKIGGPLEQIAGNFESWAPTITAVSVGLTSLASAFDVVGTTIGATIGFLYEAIAHPTMAEEFAQVAHNIARAAGAGPDPQATKPGLPAPASASSGGGASKGTLGLSGAGAGGGGGEGGWAVPWARPERYAAPWEASQRFGSDPPQRFGSALVEQANQARAISVESQARESAAPAQVIVNNTFNIDGGKHSAQEVAQVVQDKLDQMFRDMGRGARGVSPRRL